MLSVATKVKLADVLTTLADCHTQVESVRKVLCKQPEFILERVFKHLAFPSIEFVSKPSLARFLEERFLDFKKVEIDIFYELYAKFDPHNMSLSE